MAIIKCPECQHDISDEAIVCPNCGYPISKLTIHNDEILVVRRGFALASAICATVYVFFPIFMYLGNYASLSISGLGSTVGNALYIHIVLLLIAIVFNFSGFFLKKRNLVLTAAILYSASAVFFILFLFFLVLPIVFGFVGYAKMRPKRMRIDEYMLD